MKILSILSLVSFALSFITNLIFNLIVTPVKKEMERRSDGLHYVNDNDLKDYYKINKPMILIKIKILDIIIEYGSFLFYIIFSTLFLIISYVVKSSILWTLLCIPFLIFFYFIITLISTFLSRILVK